MNNQIEQKITEFFSVIEREVQRMEYGTVTVNVQISSGLPIVPTLNLVKSKRIRYKSSNQD